MCVVIVVARRSFYKQHSAYIKHQVVPLKRLKNQGAKKVIFTACHSGRLKLTITSPNIISTSPQNVWWAGLILQFFCNLNSSKNLTCPSGQLKTEFTSLIAKSTSPGLLDATFFARWKQSYLTIIPEKWWQLLTRGGCLRQGPTLRL